MRASTLFAVSAAILLGLGAVVFGRYAGWFDRQPVAEKKEAPYKVLVGKVNLFEGTTLLGTDVTVRNLREDELPHFLKNQDKYLPAEPNAAHQRVLARSVRAGQPLVNEDFQDLSLPKSLTDRLDPNMRAVNLSLPAEQAAGNMLRVGERVDVYLTTDICADSSCSTKVTRTAAIARGAPIIVKRNILWNVMKPVDDTKPMAYTLEVNPYRAALIEYARVKGTLTMVPSPTPRGMVTSGTYGFTDPESKEFADEAGKVTDFLAGRATVGDHDLMRIFQVKIAPPTPRVPPIAVERFSGIQAVGTHMFPAGGRTNGMTQAAYNNYSNEPPVMEGITSPVFVPAGTGGKDCPTCKSKKKK